MLERPGRVNTTQANVAHVLLGQQREAGGNTGAPHLQRQHIALWPLGCEGGGGLAHARTDLNDQWSAAPEGIVHPEAGVSESIVRDHPRIGVRCPRCLLTGCEPKAAAGVGQHGPDMLAVRGEAVPRSRWR